jgi:hypothetical protein
MLKPSAMTALVTALTLLMTSGLAAQALAAEQLFTASLLGGNETPLTLSTAGTGAFTALLDASETSLTFQLVYTGLEGGTVIGAHIHLGRPAITGGIVIHFCGTGGKPACPPSPTLLTGTVTAADVVAVTPQGITAGEFSEVVRALRRGDAYVNVHTTTYPGGEIRGQVQ